MTNKKQNLVWIDLEMTGLNLASDVILEFAMIITDANFEVIVPELHFVIHQPDDILSSMNKWCKKYHTQSGLVQEVKESTMTVEDVEEKVLPFIKNSCSPKTALLAGNSVWNDRNFMQKYMPRIIDYLHYKLLDVTSIAQVIKLWYPNDPRVEFKKSDIHRAHYDINESVAELKHYRQFFMAS